MGLDMYLIGKQSLLFEEEVSGEFQKTAENRFPFIKDLGLIVHSVSYEIMYWRKANAIHQWFVKNVQNGVDDCGEYYVELEQLSELATLCKKIIVNPSQADTLLPTQRGFFFGETQYDDYYLSKIEMTSTALEKYLQFQNNPDNNMRIQTYYRSSW